MQLYISKPDCGRIWLTYKYLPGPFLQNVNKIIWPVVAMLPTNLLQLKFQKLLTKYDYYTECLRRWLLHLYDNNQDNKLYATHRFEQLTFGWLWHYSDVIMSTMTSQISSVSIVCSTVCSGADQRKRQSSASLAFVMGMQRWLVDSPYKGPVMRKMFPFDDVIMGRYAPCKHMIEFHILLHQQSWPSVV